ncbi:MAG: hypothetical protein SV375_18950, partial [Thermodesulfobacteriota bacterium]|nr:hypothetical protein [Thermodesulfobacteriota bacterium]
DGYFCWVSSSKIQSVSSIGECEFSAIGAEDIYLLTVLFYLPLADSLFSLIRLPKGHDKVPWVRAMYTVGIQLHKRENHQVLDLRHK